MVERLSSISARVSALVAGQRIPLAFVTMLACGASLAGCESEDPPITVLDGGESDAGPPDLGGADAGLDAGDSDAGERDAAVVDGSALDAGDGDAGAPDAGPPECVRAADDYFPDVGMRDTTAWPACISDDGVYHPFSTSTIGGVTRADQYRQIITLLFDATRDPSVGDFLSARTFYANTADVTAGIAIRIGRRADFHYIDSVPAGTDCTAPGVAATYPEFCVGPAQLEPLINTAFTAGSTAGTPDTRVEAAKIEAGLIWFHYLSPLSEIRGCTTTKSNCDSAYAYYTGGAAARDGVGLSAYVLAADPLAHDRAWDGVLAMRCWRDLDPDATATNLALRDRAAAQLDRAILDGVVAVVRARAVLLGTTAGSERDAHWAFVRTLGGFLDRAMRAEDSGAADALAVEVAKADGAAVDVRAVTDALDAVFVCP